MGDVRDGNKACAPVSLFVYNRIEHTKRTVEALLNNELAKYTDIYIYSDGPRKGDEIKVDEIRRYLHTINGFQKITLCFRKKNVGLTKNIVSGVSEVVNKYGKVIVVEDDIVTSPDFLNYMNHFLNLYENSNSVMCVSGYSPLKDHYGSLPPFFFVKGRGDCWGWATWRRAWSCFEKNPSKVIRETSLIEAIRFDHSGSYYSQIMRNYLGELNSWAVFWDYSIFRCGGLCLCPRESLVINIGFDGTGVNCKKTDTSSSVNIDKVYRSDNHNFKHYKEIEYNPSVEKEYRRVFNMNQLGFLRRMYSKLKWLELFFLCKRRLIMGTNCFEGGGKEKNTSAS